MTALPNIRSTFGPKRRAKNSLSDSSSTPIGLLLRRKVSAIIAGAIMDEVYGAFRIDNGDAGKRVSPGRPGMCKKRSLAAGEDL